MDFGNEVQLLPYWKLSRLAREAWGRKKKRVLNL